VVRVGEDGTLAIAFRKSEAGEAQIRRILSEILGVQSDQVAVGSAS
jgi:hypothetical protein